MLDRLRRLWQHGGSGEGAGTVAKPPVLREQGAGGLVPWLPAKRALETQICGSDAEGVLRGPDSLVFGDRWEEDYGGEGRDS